MKPETIFDVIMKLTGEVEPVSDSAIDNIRLNNMLTFIHVFDRMHNVIDGVANRHKNSPHYSAKQIGQLAEKHIESMGIE